MSASWPRAESLRRRQFQVLQPQCPYVAAVLATALQRADGDSARSVLDYARRSFRSTGDRLATGVRPGTSTWIFGALKGRFRVGHRPKGIHIGALGLRLTAADMLKLGELYRDHGQWQDKQLVPAAWIAESTEPGPERSWYGLFWWLEPTNRRPYYLALGSDGQHIAIAPRPRPRHGHPLGHIRSTPDERRRARHSACRPGHQLHQLRTAILR